MAAKAALVYSLYSVLFLIFYIYIFFFIIIISFTRHPRTKLWFKRKDMSFPFFCFVLNSILI